MSILRNQQLFSIGSSSSTNVSNVLSTSNSRRRSSNSNKNNILNRSYNIQTGGSNNSSVLSRDSSSTSQKSSFIDSDLLETNIKEIEYTLLGLMDSEAMASRNSQRLASISSVKNKLYTGENSGRRGRIVSVNKNRKNSNTSAHMSPETSIQGILNSSSSRNINSDSYNQSQQFIQSSKYLCKENVDPSYRQNLNDSIFLDTPPYFSSPESKSTQYSNYREGVNPLANNHNLAVSQHSSLLNNSYSAMSINSVDHSSPRIYGQNYDSLLNSPKLSSSPTPYRKKNGEIIMVKTPCFYENNFNGSDHGYLNSHENNSSVQKNSKNFNSYTNYHSQDSFVSNQNFSSPQFNKSDISFQSPNPSNSIDSFKTGQNNKDINNHMHTPGSNNKKSVKMSVPSNKRQILEEEFRKEKYPCNEKLQKLSNRLNMKYEEVQRYFKKRRTEEKETNNKFSNLVKLLNNYLETEE